MYDILDCYNIHTWILQSSFSLCPHIIDNFVQHKYHSRRLEPTTCQVLILWWINDCDQRSTIKWLLTTSKGHLIDIEKFWYMCYSSDTSSLNRDTLAFVVYMFFRLVVVVDHELHKFWIITIHGSCGSCGILKIVGALGMHQWYKIHGQQSPSPTWQPSQRFWCLHLQGVREPHQHHCLMNNPG